MRAAYWIRERHLGSGQDGEAVTALSLEVHYSDRVCSVSIALTPPLPGNTPEKEAALEELKRLRAALDEILAPRAH